MKKEYNKTKKLVISGLLAAAVCLAAGLFWYLGKMNQSVVPAEVVTEAESKPAEVTVPEITVPEETERQEPKTQEEPEEEENAEKKEAAEREPETREEAKEPESKPEIADAETVTNQEQEPQYEEETVPEQQEPEGGTVNENGQIYVPGFGYIDDPGPAIMEPAGSDGDWNKQIGEMN